MKVTALAIAALSFAALAAHADDADPSGQFAAAPGSQAARTEVQAQYHRGVSPWSTSYNPLTTFRSQRTRAEVTAEYLASRNAVAALTSEDSGSAYLAARKQPAFGGRQLAGTPVNAQ